MTPSNSSATLLNGVSLNSPPQGSLWRCWAHNGCGKSTLAKHFNAILLPQQGQGAGGRAWIRRDEDHLYDIRQKVGMVFQNPDNQIVATVVEEDVAFAPENLGVPPDGDPPPGGRRPEGRWACTNTGSTRPISSPAARSSGWPLPASSPCGPDCMVLDEPTAMLDPQGRGEVHAAPSSSSTGSTGITVVLITHYMDEAAQADRVIVMSRRHAS